MAPALENATYLDRARGDGVRVLRAEGDAALRQLFVALLRNANGVSMILEGQDGASAEARALHAHPHAAVFDNLVPRLSDIDAAVQLRKLQPALRSNSAVRA
jgi:DNA-binding NarL/FixJ family response regulator